MRNPGRYFCTERPEHRDREWMYPSSALPKHTCQGKTLLQEPDTGPEEPSHNEYEPAQHGDTHGLRGHPALIRLRPRPVEEMRRIGRNCRSCSEERPGALSCFMPGSTSARSWVGEAVALYVLWAYTYIPRRAQLGHLWSAFRGFHPERYAVLHNAAMLRPPSRRIRPARRSKFGVGAAGFGTDMDDRGSKLMRGSTIVWPRSAHN